jgi:hypothetical protein
MHDFQYFNILKMYPHFCIYLYVQGGSLNRGKNGTELPPPPVLVCEGRNYYYLIGWDPSTGLGIGEEAGGGLVAV